MLALANAHLDPAHLGALHRAVETVRTEGVVGVAFPDLTRKPWALRLTEEFRSGACHAGRYEGSIVLAARPELVREEVRRALPANPRSLSVAIREGRQSFAEAGGPEAYFGWPAEASAEEGRATIEALGAILAEAVTAELGKQPEREP
jgi:creatinine amidohydrolase